MTQTMTCTETFYIEHCCRCGIPFGITRDFEQRRRDDEAGFYCPAGHRQVYCESTESRLRKELEREQGRYSSALDRLRRERDCREKTERKLSATRGVVTRTKNRIGKGICPCCNRSFKNLREHMQGQHPEYAETFSGESK